VTRTYRFYKEPTGEWYIDIPEWEGSKIDLQMVAGADIFLDILSQGEIEIEVSLSDVYYNGYSELEMKELGRLEGWEMGTGAWYKLISYRGIPYFDLDIWLCDVTKFVFGDFPKTIYFSVYG
jgi:hypothetical protein